MSKHTPGPWDVDEVYEDDEQRCIGIVKEGHGYIAGIHILASADTGDTEFTAEDEANAHLIAAAPAMYAALKAIQAWSFGQPWPRRELKQFTDIDAALAQAEGLA